MADIEGVKSQLASPETSIAYSTLYPFALRAAILLDVPKIISSAGEGVALSAKEICAHLPNPNRSSSENLEKVLDVLSCYGLFTATVEVLESNVSVKKYGLTSSSQELIHGSSADNLLLLTAPELIQLWPRIHEFVLNPEDDISEKVYGKGFYQHLEEDAPELKKFHVQAMTRMSAVHVETLFKHYDNELRALAGKFVDVGGSQGAVAASVAAKYPNLQAVVNFDLPHIVSAAPAIPGVEHVGGSFIDFVPEGDLLMMKFVLLNWDDEKTVKILNNCYKALPARGKLIIIDRVKPEDLDKAGIRERLIYASQDMLTGVAFKGAKSRSLEQLRRAAEAAGFASLRVVDTIDTVTLLEASKS